MSKLSGYYQCGVDTPMGRQEFLLTVKAEGDTFRGKAGGAIGGSEGSMKFDGRIEGEDTLIWSMPVPKPMPVTLACRATVDGDQLAGKVKAGIFGSYNISGTRTAAPAGEE